MKNNATEAMQLANLIAFLGKYATPCSDCNTERYINAIQQCAHHLNQWDIDFSIDREYNVLTAKFWLENSGISNVTFDVDFEAIEKDYDLENLPYSVCNKGLN